MADLANQELREEVGHRQAALFASQERQTFHMRCQDVVNYILPHAGTLFCREPGIAEARWQHILDTEASYCLDVATNGLVSYMAPPGGQWMGLVERDPDIAEIPAVKEWLGKVSDRMLSLFGQSNTYNSLRTLKRDSQAFGGGVQIVDFDDIYTLWHYPVQAGEYAIAADERGLIDTLYRELTMTVRQLVRKFGEENCSTQVQRMWKNGRKEWDRPVKVFHCIEPREDASSLPYDQPQGALDMPWRSVYWEADAPKTDGVLRESGYRLFPVLAPRMDTIGTGIYGYGPGPMCVPHVRSLQHRHHRLAENIDWKTDPMKVLPTSARGQEGMFRPGGHMFADMANPESVRAAWENRTDLSHLLLDIEDVRKQIRRFWNVDAFLMFASIDRANTTAAEIYERRQEKIDILGPQTARLFNEILRPLADIAFAYMQMKGMLPQPIPRELLERGAAIDPEFDSVLAKSAKSSKIAAQSQFTSYALAIAQADPSVVHVVDTAALIREQADLTGVTPKAIRSEEKVAELNEAAAQQAAAMQQVAAQEQLSKATKNYATSPTDTNNALVQGGA